MAVVSKDEISGRSPKEGVYVCLVGVEYNVLCGRYTPKGGGDRVGTTVDEATGGQARDSETEKVTFGNRLPE